MEDYALYGRALSTSEISYLAKSQNPVIGANQAPIINKPSNRVNKIKDGVNFTLDASDPNGDALTFSATGLPSGLSLNPTSGNISGKPNRPGTFTPQVTVSDGRTSAKTSFEWAIRGNLTVDPILTHPNQYYSKLYSTL